jgi:hypothetical protein
VDPDLWLQPLATVVGALIVGTAAYLTLRQRRSADDALIAVEREVLAHQREVDRREAWWHRAQWAIDKSLSEDVAAREVGVEAMAILADDGSGTPVDLALLLMVGEDFLDDAVGEVHHGEDGQPRPDTVGGGS